MMAALGEAARNRGGRTAGDANRVRVLQFRRSDSRAPRSAAGAGVRDRPGDAHPLSAARAGARQRPACCRRTIGRTSRTFGNTTTTRRRRSSCSMRPDFPRGTGRRALSPDAENFDRRIHAPAGRGARRTVEARGRGARTAAARKSPRSIPTSTHGSFQLYTLRWVGANNDPDIFDYVFSSKRMPPVGANRGHYRNPALDALLDAERKQKWHRDKRKAILSQIQKTDRGGRAVYRFVVRTITSACIGASDGNQAGADRGATIFWMRRRIR